MPALSLTLDHKKGVWYDRLTGETFSGFTFLFLGARKRRSMWYNLEALGGRREVCSSDDAVTGSPKSGFPWPIAPEMEEKFDHATGTIKCDECVFRQFDKHVWKNPPCTAQYVCPILFSENETAPLEQWHVAYLNLRGSTVRDLKQARDKITATDDVWFARTFTTKPFMKSLKGKMFAAAGIKSVGKFDYTSNDLTIINRRFDELEASRNEIPEPVQGLKGVLGIKKGD